MSDRENTTRIAVVLNGNARAVRPEVIAELGRVLRGEDIFVTRSPEQGQFIARTIVNRGYDVVLCGGGDGTFSQCVSDVRALAPRREPAFGVLRLGTGNALATTLGASTPNEAGLAADLRMAADPSARRPLGLLQVEGRLAPFAGVGLDALILEDYNVVKRALGRTPARALGQGAPGYALAVASRSLLRLLSPGSRPELVIRNEGEPAQRIDLRGRPLGRPVPRGGVLHEGPVLIAAASTVPYYGLGLRLFPQAELRPDRFQLRVADLDPFRVLPHLPALFRGELEDPGIRDFTCTAVSLHLASPSSFQLGGDELGRRSFLRLGLTEVTAVARGVGSTREAASAALARALG
jgi:diacylglycerol kinase family enzyme